MSEHGLRRKDINAERVENLDADDLIRLFTMRLATYHNEHNLSRSRCIGEVAKEFRDDYRVNVLRVLDERGWSHPDGFRWNIDSPSEETIRKYDPVRPESKWDGGTADIRPGDILKIDDDGLLVVGVNDTHLVGMNASGKLDRHALATVRELFNRSDISASLVRGGEVIRGVDAGSPEERASDTNRSGSDLA